MEEKLIEVGIILQIICIVSFKGLVTTQSVSRIITHPPKVPRLFHTGKEPQTYRKGSTRVKMIFENTHG